MPVARHLFLLLAGSGRRWGDGRRQQDLKGCAGLRSLLNGEMLCAARARAAPGPGSLRRASCCRQLASESQNKRSGPFDLPLLLLSPCNAPTSSLLLLGKFLPGEFTEVTSQTPTNQADALSHHEVTERIPQKEAGLYRRKFVYR